MARFGGDAFPEYVSAAERRARAAVQLRALERQGLRPSPIRIAGREIAITFWGKAWCAHLEGLADFQSRLPRGRSYVRGGAVLHLALSRGEVRARVAGTDLYEVEIGVAPLPAPRWKEVRRACAGQIATAVELLSGKLSSAVMGVLCDPERGLFPRTEELDLHCSCPDGAWLCKHLAAVLYGVGARLDEAPELLFTLRGVPQGDLLADASAIGSRANAAPASRFSDAELSEIFGIELGGRADPAGEALEPRGPRRRGAGSGKGKAGTGRARARRRSRS
jgi:uncharacterized Zn finger protein